MLSVRRITALLAALKAPTFRPPFKAARAATLTILPPPCYSMWGTTAWLAIKTVRAFSASRWSNV